MRYRVKNVTKNELSRATLKGKKNVARISSMTGQGRTETPAYKATPFFPPKKTPKGTSPTKPHHLVITWFLRWV